MDTTGAVGVRASGSLRVDRLGRLGVVAESGDLRDGSDWSLAGTLALDFG